MKVLHVIDNLAPGGAERVMVNACNWLHEAGVAVEAVLIVGRQMDLAGELRSDIPLHVLGRRGRADWAAARALARRMRDADLVHAHMRHNYRYAALVCRLFGVKTRLILHDHSSSPSLLAGLNSIFRPDYYIGTSAFSLAFARDRLRMSQNVFLLENAVEAHPIDPTLSREGIALVSNIKPIKNQAFALRVAALLSERLYLYGAVQDRDYFAALRRACREEGLAVVWRTERCDIPAALNRHCMGLHVSPNETGPLAVIEYLAQGLPFLAYRTGAAADLIGRYFPEFFIDCFEPEAWVERIRQLLAAPPDRARMAEVFERHFSKKRYVEQCLEIYRRVLAS
ncbi:MAG: glycosyltransferase family 4 protein [Saprospiraceae bacterium]